MEFIKEPVAFANSVWFTYVASKEDVKLSKLFNLLFAEDVNWLSDAVTFASVVNLVSTEPVYVANVEFLVFSDALNAPNKSILFCCEAVDAFKLDVTFANVVNLVSMDDV